jgi:hypothetical protein
MDDAVTGRGVDELSGEIDFEKTSAAGAKGKKVSYVILPLVFFYW